MHLTRLTSLVLLDFASCRGSDSTYQRHWLSRQQIALVSSRLDYCNSLYQCLSKSNLIRLQCLQNALVRVVMGSCKWTHITPVLKSLHWLSVKERITFKPATLIYKHLDSGLLQYFHEYINYFTHFVNTRCAVATKKY